MYRIVMAAIAAVGLSAFSASAEIACIGDPGGKCEKEQGLEPILLELDRTNINLTAGGEGNPTEFSFDLNKDGVDDFEIGIFEPRLDLPGIDAREIATIKALEQDDFMGAVLVLPPLIEFPGQQSNLNEDIVLVTGEQLNVGDPLNGGGLFIDELFLPPGEIVVQELGLGFVADFEERDLIGIQDGIWAPAAALYAEGSVEEDVAFELGFLPGPFAEGPFATTGFTGFIGLSLTESGNNGSEFFGWAEITRGSVTVGQVGVQQNGNTPAAIAVSEVPAPPALWLLAAALGLLGAAKRRGA